MKEKLKKIFALFSIILLCTINVFAVTPEISIEGEGYVKARRSEKCYFKSNV